MQEHAPLSTEKQGERPPLSFHLTLPLPPSINEQYATVNGRRVSTKVARRFKRVVLDALRALEQQGIVTEELKQAFRDHYLSLFLDLYFMSPLKRDLDGPLKITQDAVFEGLGGLNDNRVVDLHLVKHIDPLHPRLELDVEVIYDWQFDQEYMILP